MPSSKGNSKGGGAGKHGASKVNFWCRWIARKPSVMFGIFLSLHIGSVILTGILLVSGYSILPLVFDDLPLEMNEEYMFLRNEAWLNRNDDLEDEEDAANATTRLRRDVAHLPGLDSSPPGTSPGSERSQTVYLNVQEDFQSQLRGFKSSAMAARLLGSGLGALGSLWGHEPAVMPEFLSDVVTEALARKAFLPRFDDCCEMTYGASLLRKGQCSCDPHLGGGVEETSREGGGQRHRRSTTVVDPSTERRKTLTTITLIYEDPDGNIFTKENLRKIALFEYSLYNHEEFRKYYCKTFKVSNSLHCQPFTSVLRYFDGTYAGEDDKFFDPSFTDVTGVIVKAAESEALSDSLRFFLSKDAQINSTSNTAISRRTRSLVYYGYPLQDYLDRTDQSKYRSVQRDIWRDWARVTLVPIFTENYASSISGLSFYYVSTTLYWAEVLASVPNDLMWLIAGFGFIFLFMLFQTGSFWITGFGMFSVLTSFFSANLFYNIVIGYKFFGIFNVLALFIILGIGADDIFIYSDTWKLYSTVRFDSLEERVSVVFKRAAISMFITSLTTMVAFFVSSFSPLLPISAFGTYAGLCILVNYLSVVSFFPCVVVLYHKYFQKYACCCCGRKKSSPTSSVGTADIHSSNGVDPNTPRPISRSSIASVENVEKSTENLQEKAKQDSPPSDRINALIVHFLSNRFFRFVTNKYARVVILLAFVLLMALSLYSALQVKLSNNQFRLFDPRTPEEVSNTKNTYDFKTAADEPTVDLTISWGLAPQDRSQCNRLTYSSEYPCKGKTVWVNDFSLNDEKSQMALLNFCTYLSSGIDTTLRDKLQIGYNSDTNKNNITCFIEPMAEFFKTEHELPQYPPNISLALPITVSKMQMIMDYNPYIYQPGSSALVTQPFELALEYWLTNRYSNDSVPDNRAKYRRYIGSRKVSEINLGTEDNEEIYQRKLAYAGLMVSTTAPALRISLTDAFPLLEQWETFVNTEMDKMPPNLQHGFQQSRMWVWINILQNLSTQSFTAFGVGLALAFVVIFLGTQNVITGFCATLLLACVTCCVIAVIPLAGWTFGLLEALNFCLIVGLAVDYIVHLAEGYHMSSFTGRLDRIRDTLEKVGISVLSGAVTTLGSSFFMIFARIIFFRQFGIFMFCTIGCSMLFALFVLLAAYSIFGPQGYFGSFVPLYRDRAKYREHRPEKKWAHGEENGNDGQNNPAFQTETHATPL